MSGSVEVAVGITRKDGTDPEIPPSAERWQVLGRRELYTSPWVTLNLVRVVPPRSDPYEHHVVTVPDAVGIVLRHPDRGVLLLYRHRFITDTTGFEIPAGGIGEGETVEDAAAREALEETGWEAADITHMTSCNSSDGVSSQRFHFVLATAARYVETPVDDYEASSRVWVPRDEIAPLIRSGRVPGALSTVALLYALHFDLL
jgi:8-oxo-dGTP pyrophosphatase MutT (NUDIX family)